MIEIEARVRVGMPRMRRKICKIRPVHHRFDQQFLAVGVCPILEGYQTKEELEPALAQVEETGRDCRTTVPFCVIWCCLMAQIPAWFQGRGSGFPSWSTAMCSLPVNFQKE